MSVGIANYIMTGGQRVFILKPLLLLAGLLASVDSYKVLLVFPLPTPSHAILGRGFARELLLKGHEVTFITMFPQTNAEKNLTQIDVHDLLSDFARLGAVEMPKLLEGKSFTDDLKLSLYMMEGISRKLIVHEAVQALMLDTTKNFDVVVVEWYHNEILAGLSAIFQCPLVWSSSLDLHSGLSRMVDDVLNPSYTSDVLGSEVPPFTFLQRVKNLWSILRIIHYSDSLKPKAASDYEKMFLAAASRRGVKLPPYYDLIYNASLIFINSHPSLGAAIKLPQNVKGIGGYHVDVNTKPLPQDIQKIMDESEHGVIFFSLGSYMKSKIMPEQMKTALLQMFGELKQTVLWKFEDELPGRPKNVHIRSWLPQPSILAHPNTKLFITHGGLLSTTETVHYGVPIIGIPLFGDQFLNMEIAVKKGLGVSVKVSHNLADDLRPAIEHVLNNSSYRATAARISSLYHDRPLPPGDELVYWLEYVVRTGGAPHLRSAALHLPWYQKLYLDLLALIAALLFGLVVLVKYSIKFCKSKYENTKTVTRIHKKIN